MNSIAIDARFLLRAKRGMSLYVNQICSLLPSQMPNTKFYFLINKEFEHNLPSVDYQPLLSKLLKMKNTEVIDITAPNEFIWEQIKLPLFLRKINPDLLHMPTNRVCLFTSIKQVSTFHDCLEFEHLTKIHSIPSKASLKLKFYILRKRIYVWLIYVYGLRKLDAVFTISKFSKHSLLNHFPFLQNKKINYIYHGIPPGYKLSTPPLKYEERKGILMLGGDSFQKNARNAIIAWSSLDKIIKQKHPLTIAGFTGDNKSIIIKTLIELGIEEQVNIRRWLSDAELIRLFQKSAVFLFVSREEGFGFPMLQAMASGTPIVHSNARALIEIYGNDEDPPSPEKPIKITHKLESILSSKDLWYALQYYGLVRSSKFEWDNTVLEMSIRYREAVEAK